ncbi:hypothetical protein F4777DRAFT_591700 [Nemania sp. FL0916]|nr:hypothetical protein F4777DRAFT_591700 [Nemania sp. FL0916]
MDIKAIDESGSEGDEGGNLREQHIRTHPWIVDWVELDWEHFKNRYGPDEGRHIIEVLKIGPRLLDEVKEDRRRRNVMAPKHLSVPHSLTAGASSIQRIRIQSPVLISQLAYASGVNMEDSPGRIYTFISPFPFLKFCQPKMKLALERLEEKCAKTEPSVDTTAASSAVNNDKAQAEEVAESAGRSDSEKISSQLYSYTDMDDRTSLDHLRCFVKFVDKEVIPSSFYFQDASRKEVRFEDIPILFSPGELIYWPSAGSITSVAYPLYQPAWRVYSVGRSVQGDTGLDDIESDTRSNYRIKCYYIDHDGDSYTTISGDLTIMTFAGNKHITDLPAYPFRYRNDKTKGLEELKHQGNLFQHFIKERHSYYNGWSIPDELLRGYDNKDEEDLLYSRKPKGRTNMMPSSPEYVDSHVAIDFAEAFGRHPRWKPPVRIPTEYDSDKALIRDIYDLIHWKDKSREESLYRVNELLFEYDVGAYKFRDEYVKGDACITLSASKSLKAIKDEDAVLLPRRLVAYAFQERKFLVLDVLSLRNLVEHEDLFKDLKINPGYQDMIQALVQAHSERRKIQNEWPFLTLNQNLFNGKGAGLFILLYGAPGVGKTATAEAVAQRYKKPLFSITCGNLGLSPREVEDELKEIFRLAHRWDCVVLLDEADVFLARRDISSLKRNALVSVFLRVLEYYSGILFLTTNRVGIIDEAFKSRIHLSLYYERLDEKRMLEIFEINIRKLKDIEASKTKELAGTQLAEAELVIRKKKILKFAKEHWDRTQSHLRWNGRQIRKNYFANDKSERPILDDSHFERVAATIEAFDAYFESATGQTDGGAALLEGTRDDRFRNEDPNLRMRPSELLSGIGKSSRGTKAREKDPERSRKHQTSGKGKKRDYYGEEQEEKSTKEKKKSSKLVSLHSEAEGSKSRSRRKAEQHPHSSSKPIAGSSTKHTTASRRGKKTRNEQYKEEDDDDSDDNDTISYSEGTDSAEESSSEDQSDEEDSDASD